MHVGFGDLKVFANQSVLSRFLGALSDPTRRGIFELLALGPRSVGELAKYFPVSRSAVSQHLKILKEVALVSEARSGQQNIYSADANAAVQLSSLAGYAEGLSRQLAPPEAQCDTEKKNVEVLGVDTEVMDPLESVGINWQAISDETDPQVVTLVARMFIVGRSMEKLFAHAAAGHDLNIGEVMILGTLRRLGTNGGCTPTQLGKSSLISLPGVAKRLNRLERLELVARIVDEQDRRSSQVRLTDAGHRTFLAISHEQFTKNYVTFAQLPAAQRKQLDAILRYLQGSLPSVS